MRRPLDGDEPGDDGLPRRSEALLAGRADRRDRRARGVERRRPARRRAATPASSIGSGGGGIDVGERQYHDFFIDRRPQRHAYAIAVVDRRHGVERDLDLAAAARHQPRAVVRLHELDRRDRLRRGADPVRRGRRAAVGRRRRCVTPGMIFGFSRMRAVSTRYNDRPAEASRPFDRGATASCSARARGWSCSSARIARARAARRIYASIDGYGSTCDAYHRVQMDPDGDEIVRASTMALERSGRAPRGDRLRQLPRHVDAAERRGRVALRAPGVRRARRARAGLVDQVDDRPPAGRQRRRRRRDRRAGAAAAASCRRRSTSTIRIRPATSTSSRITARRAEVDAALCNCLGFGSKNSALVLGRGMTHD